MKTKIIDNVEYELEQHDNGKTLKEIKIPKGWRLLKPWEAQRLWDMGYLRHNWFFVENTNKKLKKQSRVARFYTNSDGVGFDCNWNQSDGYADLGVVFCRELPKSKGDKK